MLFTIGYEKSVFPAVAEVLQGALSDLIGLARTESPCMMCYERDPRHCHRLLIGERVQAITDVAVRDLFA